MGIVKWNPAKLRRDRKRNLDEIVEVGLTADVAEAANVMGFQGAQSAKAVEHHAGLGTNDVPTHLEQPTPCRMEKQIDAFRLGDGAIARECQRIDPVEGEIVTVSDQRFKFRDHTRAPGSGLLNLGHLAFEEPLLDVGHCAPESLQWHEQEWSRSN